MSLKEHGSKRFGRMISKNVDEAYYVESLVNQHEDLEMLAPVGMDIVCFRFNPGGKNLDELNALNKEIKLQLEEQAIALPGYTTLNGMYCIRFAISSHRTTQQDFDDVVNAIRSIGHSLLN